jgi:hypothetical protein
MLPLHDSLQNALKLGDMQDQSLMNFLWKPPKPSQKKLLRDRRQQKALFTSTGNGIPEVLLDSYCVKPTTSICKDTMASTAL